MNVPILTWPGRSFASASAPVSCARPASANWCCTTPEEYVERAVELGHNRDMLAAIKAKLAAGPRHQSFVRYAATCAAPREACTGKCGATSRTAICRCRDLRNLDIYHEIGAGLDLENIENLSDEAYRALYQKNSPSGTASILIQSDDRLWPGAEPERAPVAAQRVA